MLLKQELGHLNQLVQILIKPRILICTNKYKRSAKEDNPYTLCVYFLHAD